MAYVFTIFIIVSAILLPIGVVQSKKKSKNTPTNLKAPIYALYIGILGCLFYVVLGIMLVVDMGAVGLIIILFLCPIVLICLWLILYQKNWNVKIEGNTFIYVNWQKKSQVFDIAELQMKTNYQHIIFSKGKKCIVRISYTMPSILAFAKNFNLLKNGKTED